MRRTKTHAKLQKIEEQDVFGLFYEALEIATIQSHLTNLSLVRAHFISGNNDMTVRVWDIFLHILYELKLRMPNVSVHPTDEGKGNCYFIPRDIPKNSLRRLQALTQRREWRRQWCEMYEAGMPEEILLKARSRLRVVK